MIIEDRASAHIPAWHQFCRVGKEAYIGGYSVVVKDALPFALTVGNHAKCYGLNITGMKRRGYSRATIDALHHAFHLLLSAKLNTTQAVERINQEITDFPKFPICFGSSKPPSAALPNEVRIDCGQRQVSLHGRGGRASRVCCWWWPRSARRLILRWTSAPSA